MKRQTFRILWPLADRVVSGAWIAMMFHSARANGKIDKAHRLSLPLAEKAKILHMAGEITLAPLMRPTVFWTNLDYGAQGPYITAPKGEL